MFKLAETKPSPGIVFKPKAAIFLACLIWPSLSPSTFESEPLTAEIPTFIASGAAPTTGIIPTVSILSWMLSKILVPASDLCLSSILL